MSKEHASRSIMSNGPFYTCQAFQIFFHSSQISALPLDLVNMHKVSLESVAKSPKYRILGTRGTCQFYKVMYDRRQALTPGIHFFLKIRLPYFHVVDVCETSLI